jgi:bifunctional enzyme CysN/CysC
VIVAVNKMDLVEFSEAVFDQIREAYLAFAEKLNLHDIRFLPLSALKGDNVVNRSAHMPWYEGLPLMELLDTIEIADDQNFENPRFPVQYVNRPQPGFPGLQRHDRGGHLPQGRSGHGLALAQNQPNRLHRDL